MTDSSMRDFEGGRCSFRYLHFAIYTRFGAADDGGTIHARETRAIFSNTAFDI